MYQSVGGEYCTMRWSIFPKTDWPSRSSISISTRSPNDMNGVFGAPSAIVSRQRTSARQQEPFSLPTLETVPQPTTVPVMRSRDFAQ